MRITTSRLSAGVAGLLTVGTAAGLVLAGAGVANAAGTTPPWETPTTDANAVGTITFYNAAGNVVTSGSTGSSSTAPFAAYAVGSNTVRSGDTSAVINFANPDPAQPVFNWYVEQAGPFTSYPVTTGPSAIQTLSQTHPVVAGTTGDQTLEGFLSDSVVSTQAGYQNVVQVRMRTANPAGSQTDTYDVADVLVDPTAHTWTQVYPAVKTNTATTLTAAPSPATVGQSVTLTATETPAVAGSVQFVDGTTNIGSPVAVDASGVASTTTSTLTQGSHSLSAVFTPTDTTNYNGSTGTATLQVNPVATATATTLAVVQDGTAGDPITYTATVKAGTTPVTAGTVSFYDGTSTTPINATPVTSTDGTYTLTDPNGLVAGSHSVVAKFAPTDVTAFAASQSPAQNFVLQPKAVGACANTGSVCTSNANVQVTVPVGTLVINTPYTAASPLDLGTMALNTSGTEFTASAAFNNIVVTDTRSGINGLNQYTVSAQSSNLSDGKTNPGSTINAQNVGLTGVSVTPGAGFFGTTAVTNLAAGNPAADPAVAPGATGTAGLAGGKSVFSASNSTGTVTAKGTLTINAPTSTEAGLFTGTITFTVG